jgi:ribosomal protein S18 acetylase RimI-like enzyme
MQIGPFLATFNRDTDNPFLNYAIPADDAVPSRADIDALVDAYRQRNRKPRLEYIPSIAPAVEPALVSAGFEVELRTPLMTYASARLVAEPDGIELVTATSDDDLGDASAVQWEAYEETEPMPQSAVDGLRRTLDAGGIVVLARDAASREAAGAGLCTGPYDRTTELAAVAVRERFRRRGIAAAMTHRLTAEALARGIDNVFLMADGPAEERIYARVGFETISEVLHISLKSA